VSKRDIAVGTKYPSNLSGIVAVVDMPLSFARIISFADRAYPTLSVEHGVKLCLADIVLAL
jgi:hypothetical protein